MEKGRKRVIDHEKRDKGNKKVEKKGNMERFSRSMGQHRVPMQLITRYLPSCAVNGESDIRVFRFNPKKHKWQISNTIEVYIVNLDVSFLGEKQFPSKLMGRGRTSALKVYAHTYKCQKK